MLGLVDESELRLVCFLEGLGHRCDGAGRHHQRRVGAGIADMRAHDHLDRLCRDALAGDFVLHLLAEFPADRIQRFQRLGAERLLDRLLACRADIGKAHAIGRQQRRERMDQHAGHAERIGDQAGMLAAGAAEAIERIARHVIAALHRNLLDRVGHVLDRDPDEAVGDFFGLPPAADFLRERCEAFAHRLAVERLVLLRAENLREEIGDEFAGHHIGVGHRERAAAAIAGRARIGARAVGTDAKARAVEMQDRAAAGRDRVNAHHRRAHAHARDLGLEGALIFAVKVRDIGRGAAHVEADDAREARFARGLRHRHHAAGGSGQDRVLALEQIGGGEPARRHHEHQPRVRVARVEYRRPLARHICRRIGDR